MINNTLKVNEIVESVSITHPFDKYELIAVNTSDVLDGYFLTPEKLPVRELKGQFKKTIQKDDILFSEIRPANKRYARVNFENTENYVVSTKLMVLRKFNENVDLDFFYYWLTNEKNLEVLQSRAENRIGSFPQITFELLSEYHVPIPEKEVQRRIAKILKTIDSKIQSNNKINAELESMAKTLYDYWFLQFEFPNEEGKPYKSSGGKMVWNEELKREIPEGWVVENLMNTSLCSDIKAGVDYFELKNYLPTANINSENITDGDNISFDNRENRANMQPVKYSVWFAKMKNSVKHLTIPMNSDWFTEKYILSTGFQGLKCNEESLSLVHCLVNSNWFENYKDVLSHGATQEGVNNEDLKNIKFPVPTSTTLKAFSKIILPLLERKFMIIRENQELTSLRDFLLPLLMNGQVTFK